MPEIERWPFEEHAWNQEPRWWEECYVPPQDLSDFVHHPSWLMFYGGPLTGKSVLLSAIERSLIDQYLVCRYPLELWPQDEEQKHLSCLMTAASHAVMDFLREHPERIKEATTSQLEFIHWLIKRFNPPRTLGPFLDSLVLDREIDSAVRNLPDEDLYTSLDQNQVMMLIGELINLCRRWEQKGIAFLTDIPFGISNRQAKQLVDLYSWHSLAQNPGFRIIAVAPEKTMNELDLIHVSRGRVKFIPLESRREAVCEAADKHIQAATKSKISGLADLSEPVLLEKLEAIVRLEFDGLPIGSWVLMAWALLETHKTFDVRLGLDDLIPVAIRFYRRACPLHLDLNAERKGIWRGQKFLPLRNAEYEVAKRMWQERNSGDKAVSHLTLSGVTKEMMWTRIRRMREAIEPLHALDYNEVYVESFRDDGYRFWK